jgi:RHS repeat-associated protein
VRGPGYTGHVEDSSGLTYMQARYQSPVLGRMLSPDPVGAEEDPDRHFNRYAYAYNNPATLVDPDGRVPMLLPVAIFVAKELAGEAFEQATGVPAPTVKNAGRAVLKHAVREGRQDAVQRAATGVTKAPHGNKIDGRPATLYEKYDKDGNFLKHGITKHENPAKRYSAKEIDGGTVVRTDRGPRNEILKKERDLVERSPGPHNRERWAGKRLEK